MSTLMKALTMLCPCRWLLEFLMMEEADTHDLESYYWAAVKDAIKSYMGLAGRCAVGPDADAACASCSTRRHCGWDTGRRIG